MAAYEDVHVAWDGLIRDAHVGMSDAFRLVAAAANTDAGRLALSEILADEGRVALIDPDALSYLRISRDLPLPPGVPDHRADGFFRTRFYTGSRLSLSHQIENPRELLYFDFSIVMIVGTLADPAFLGQKMRGSGYLPVTVRMPDGREMAIGIVMINEFRDTTFGPYDEVVLMTSAVHERAPEYTRTIDYVNAYSLQIPLDRGGTVFTLKLWLNQLSPIDGGNDFLGTNKELGSFRFENRDGVRSFRAWDKQLEPVVSGAVPIGGSGLGPEAMAAYREAAARAGSALPSSTATTIPVASRPDGKDEGPATKWAFAVDWRSFTFRELTQRQAGLRFGRSEWPAVFERQFSPALSFHAPSGVGQIVHRIGDAPHHP